MTIIRCCLNLALDTALSPFTVQGRIERMSASVVDSFAMIRFALTPSHRSH